LGKAEIVKKWKTDLEALGFVYRDIMFQLKETTNRPLHFTISLQRNLHSETYMVHTMVLIKNPFAQDSRWQVLVSGQVADRIAAISSTKGAQPDCDRVTHPL